MNEVNINMKRALVIVSILLGVHILLLLGVLGYGLATGRFAENYRGQYLSTWKGEKLVPYVEEVVVEEEPESPQAANQRISKAQIDREVLTTELQRQMQLLRSMQSTLDLSRENVDKKSAKLVKDQDAYEAALESQNKAASEEGFLKALQTYSELSAKYVKDDFMQMDNKEVVRYLSAMKPAIRTEVLSRFRAPKEQARRVELIKLLEKEGVVEL